MYRDEIVEEIHKIREAYSRSFNHDLAAIFADLQKQQAESGREIVNLSRAGDRIARWSRRASEIGHESIGHESIGHESKDTTSQRAN